MNIYYHPRNGMLFIWANSIFGEFIVERYLYYTQKQAMKLFREKHPTRIRKTKGINRVNWCPFLLD
jgi:hypothetical protein